MVEESSWLAGIREWRQLLRENFGRIVVYEGLALMLGIAISLPLTMAIGLALYGEPCRRDGERTIELDVSARCGMCSRGRRGPAIGPAPVANVFIYLNLRYEQTSAR